MRRVERPQVIEGLRAGRDPFLDEGKHIAGRRSIGRGKADVVEAAGTGREVVFLPEVVAEPEKGLHHGNTPADQLAQDRLVGSQGRAAVALQSVIRREIEEHDVRFPGQHITIEAEETELRAGPADRRVMEREWRPGITPLQVIRHQPPITRALRVGRVRAPRQGAAEEDNIQGFAGLFAPVEPRKTGHAGRTGRVS